MEVLDGYCRGRGRDMIRFRRFLTSWGIGRWVLSQTRAVRYLHEGIEDALNT